MIIWLTGIPSSGKTTIGGALAAAIGADFLDGDEIRDTVLSEGLGFSAKDRRTHLRRVGFLAERLARHVHVVCAFVSPSESVRRELPIDFLIWVKCSAAVCRLRDCKGLYAKAACGQIVGLTGWDAVYEPPPNPDLILQTDELSEADTIAAAVAAVREAIDR